MKYWIVDFTCSYFKRFGSACKHMYCFDHNHGMLVVKKPTHERKSGATQPVSSSGTKESHESETSVTSVTANTSPVWCAILVSSIKCGKKDQFLYIIGIKLDILLHNPTLQGP
jgi:hypothetical protein